MPIGVHPSRAAAPSVCPLVENKQNGFVNRIAQAFFAKVEAKRFESHQNFFYFTPTLLPLFGMLYAGAPESVRQDLSDFLGDDGRIHETFGTWLEEEHQKCPAFLVDPLGWITHKVFALAALIFPHLFSSPTSWKTDTEKGVLIGHREGATIPKQAKRHLSHYCDEAVTFRSNLEATTKSNKWISDRTQGAIQDLVPEVPESDPVQLLLLAAANFKSSWEHPFPKEETRSGRFYNSDSTDVQVPTMKLATDDLRMAYDRQEGRYMQLLELPMHGDLAMYVVKGGGAEGVRDYLTSPALLDVLERVDGEGDPFEETSSLTVTLPKIDLKDRVDVLTELADDPLIQKIQAADWKESLVETSSPQPLQVTHMVTQTNLSLDETGVAIKAASFTFCGQQSCPPTFYANEPFGLVLYDKRSKTILGMGQMNKFEG